ncbi:MAG: hypothetical protein ACFFC6_07540, partial [Promethearchaeota archaeon]
MKQKDWIECAKRIEKDSHNYPQLKNFFRLMISLQFLFPNLNQSLFLDKKRFVKQFYLQSIWEVRFLIQHFEFQPNDALKSYLTKEDWWWLFLNNMKEEKNHEAYFLSNFHESLKKHKEKKSAGFYITPKDQIKVMCRYALFFYLKNRDEIEINDRSLYQLIFQCKYPVDFQFKDNQRIVDILLNLKILDPSCGTGLFLVEMNELLLSLILANPIFVKISSEEKTTITKNTFSQFYGFDIDSNSVKLTKIILLHFYLQKTYNEGYLEKELTEFLNRLNVSENDFFEEEI